MQDVAECSRVTMVDVSSVAVFASDPRCVVVTLARACEPTLFNMYAEEEELTERFFVLEPPGTAAAPTGAAPVTFIGQAVQAFRDVHLQFLHLQEAAAAVTR